MANVTTLDEVYRPLMDAPTVKLDRCAVCGRAWPLNQHHIVFRSQGQLIRDGKPVKKPTVTLCGDGNNLYGLAPDGTRVVWCHGKAHHRLLHFRNDHGQLEYIDLGDSPSDAAKYQAALLMDGWRPL